MMLLAGKDGPRHEFLTSSCHVAQLCAHPAVSFLQHRRTQVHLEQVCQLVYSSVVFAS